MVTAKVITDDGEAGRPGLTLFPHLMAGEMNACGFVTFFCASVRTAYVGARATVRVRGSENNTPELALSICMWSSGMELGMLGLHIAHPLTLGLAFNDLKVPSAISM